MKKMYSQGSLVNRRNIFKSVRGLVGKKNDEYIDIELEDEGFERYYS